MDIEGADRRDATSHRCASIWSALVDSTTRRKAIRSRNATAIETIIGWIQRFTTPRRKEFRLSDIRHSAGSTNGKTVVWTNDLSRVCPLVDPAFRTSHRHASLNTPVWLAGIITKTTASRADRLVARPQPSASSGPRPGPFRDHTCVLCGCMSIITRGAGSSYNETFLA